MNRQGRRFSMTGLVVVVSVVAAVAVVVWMLIIVRGEDSPILPTEEPTGVPTATPPPASPTPAATPVPTRSARPVVPPGSLPDLLTYAPDRLADGSLPLSDVARYADIARWMDARGIATPDGPGAPGYEAWEAELDNLALPAILATRADEPIWEQTYGFAITDVHQVLAVGQAPDFVLILRGDFDRDALQAAWVRSGYQAVASRNMTLWSLFPGDAIDLSAPASRPALGSFNNVVLLDDGTLIASSRITRLETALDVVRGGGGSLAANPGIATLLAPGGGALELVSAIISKGSVLEAPLPLPEATPMLTTTPVVAPLAGTPPPEAMMPPAGLAMVGIAAPADGAEPPMTIVLTFDDPEGATRAMRLADRAWRHGVSPVTGHAYTDRLKPIGLQIVGTGEGASLLVARARLEDGAGDWLDIVRDRDLGFLMRVLAEDDEARRSQS